VPLLREVADDALRIGAFRHVLDEGGFHLAVESLFDGLAAFVVLVHPARVGDGRHIHETDLQGRLGKRGN